MADEQGGLLGFLNTPTGMGLLSAVGAGLAGAQRGRPLNSIGAGLLGGVQGYGQAQQSQTAMQQAQTQQQLAQLQLKQAQQAQADQEQVRGLAKQFYTPASMTMDQVNAAPGQAGPTLQRASMLPQAQGAFDTSGFVNAMMGVDPIKGMQLKASMAKEMPFDKFKPENYTTASVAEAMRTGDYSKLVRQDKLHFADTGGGVAGLDPYTGRQVSTTDKTGNPFEDLVVRDTATGALVPNSALVGAKAGIARAGKPETNVVVDAAPKAFWSDFGKQASDQLFSERGAAQSAAGTLQSIGEIRKAVQGGAFLGAGADMKLGAAKALGAIGFNIAPDAVANSEKFNAQANNFVLEKIKTLGANPSNADREFIEKTVPRLSSDPRALPSLLDFMEQKARAQVRSYNGKIKGVQQQPGAGFMPYSLEVPEPDISGAGGWSITPVGR